jgi:hypothetical protein
MAGQKRFDPWRQISSQIFKKFRVRYSNFDGVIGGEQAQRLAHGPIWL